MSPSNLHRVIWSFINMKILIVQWLVLHVAALRLTCCSLTQRRHITRSSSWTTWAWPSTSTAALWLCACTALTPPGGKACWDRSVYVSSEDDITQEANRCADGCCRLFQIFLPAAALLAWFSCTACCYAKLRFRRPYPLHRKLCQVLPMGVAYLLDISPVAHRLATHSWTSNSALPLHGLQVALLTPDFTPINLRDFISQLYLHCTLHTTCTEISQREKEQNRHWRE